MKPRERLLVIAVGAVVVLFGLKLAYDFVAGMFEERDQALATVNKKIDESQIKVAAGHRAITQIKEWEHRSLPTDQDSPIYYSNWLMDLVSRLNFGSPTVGPMAGSGNRAAANDRDGFTKFAFEVKGECDLNMKQLVNFLYEFYTSNQLHKIRSFTLTPMKDDKLEVKMQIEAMMLPGADRKDELSIAKTKLPHLPLGDLVAYDKLITNRNFFSEYKVPPPKGPTRIPDPPPPTPPFDLAKFTEVTGITGNNDELVLWVVVKTTGEQHRVKEGEEFTVGTVKYKVVKLDLHEAKLSGDGQTKQVRIGDNLRDAALVTEPVDQQEPTKASL